MANVKISNLPAATSPVASTDVLPVVQGSITKKAAINQLGFLPAGTGATTRTIQAKLRDTVSVKDFGAVGDGVADDTAAIQAAIAAASQISFAAGGNYRITASILIDKTIFIDGNGATITADSSVLEAVKIGSVTLVDRGCLRDIKIAKAAYSGATENAGIALYNCVSTEFENVECRLFKYPWYLKPGTSQRVAYCTFVNINGIGGLYNLYINPSSDGFANENTFVGGRMFDTTDTTTHIYITAGGSAKPDHNKFLGVSVEGTGQQAIYCAGDDNYFEFPRTEGTWSVAPVVLAGDYNMLITTRYDSDVSDTGTRNQYITYGAGTKFVTAANNKTTLTVSRLGANTGSNPAVRINDTFSASGNSYGIEIRQGTDSSTSFAFKGVRDSDGLVRSSLSTDGIMTVAQQFNSEQFSWVYTPLVLGTYRFWVDSSGRLRIKNGIPTSETDGTVVGTQT
jgi:hypothetical protein